MIDNSVIIMLLLGLNLFQYFFWTWQVHKLVDKLMSRNFAEYVQVTKPVEQDVSKVQLPEDDEVLETLNRTFGI